MDLSKPVTYRGFNLNSFTVGPSTGRRSGTILEEADFGDAVAVGYTEKRSQDDGNDASDVFLGPRLVRLRGMVNGVTSAEGFDILQDLRSALTPTAAYAASPFDKGYLPLQFEQPTLDTANFPGGSKLLEVRARARSQPAFSIRRDGGSQGRKTFGIAIGWMCSMECKDPRIYIRPPTINPFTIAESGTLHNRGDYPAPIDILAEVTPGSAAGTITFVIGGVTMKFTIPDASVTQYFRYSGELKVLTVQSNSIEVLRMDLLVLDTDSTHPKVPPGDSAYSIAPTGGVTLGATSQLFYSESFA